MHMMESARDTFLRMYPCHSSMHDCIMVEAQLRAFIFALLVNLKFEYWENGNVLKTLNILKRRCFLMFYEKISSYNYNCYAHNTNYSYFVVEGKFKILRLVFVVSTKWSLKFNQILRLTRHFTSDLLRRI